MATVSFWISFWNTTNGTVNDRIRRTDPGSVDFWNDTVGNGMTGYDFEKNEIEKRDYHKFGMIRRSFLVLWFYITRYIKMILFTIDYVCLGTFNLSVFGRNVHSSKWRINRSITGSHWIWRYFRILRVGKRDKDLFSSHSIFLNLNFGN